MVLTAIKYGFMISFYCELIFLIKPILTALGFEPKLNFLETSNNLCTTRECLTKTPDRSVQLHISLADPKQLNILVPA
jgi:hypothetical protein